MDTPDLPAACFLFAGKGYDANWFRDGLIGKGIWPLHPAKEEPKIQGEFCQTPRELTNRALRRQSDVKD